MYIEDRLFSENTEETLYSILLDEDEYALYSEFQKEFGLVQRVGEAVKKNAGKLREKVSKVGNRLKNRKAVAEAKEVEIPEAVEEIKEVAKKVKPKKVKRINKELKRKKLLEGLPYKMFPGRGPDPDRANLRIARGISRQNPLELSKADFAVIKNQAEKSSRFKNGLYMRDSDPAKEAFRRQHLKELRNGGAFNSQFDDKIRLKNARERFRHMDVAGTHNFDAGENYIGESWFEKGPFIEY